MAGFGPADPAWFDLWLAWAELYASRGNFAQAAAAYGYCAQFMAAVAGAGDIRTAPCLAAQAQCLALAGDRVQAQALAAQVQAMLGAATPAECAALPGGRGRSRALLAIK